MMAPSEEHLPAARLIRAAAAGDQAALKLAGAGAVAKTPVLARAARVTRPFYVVLRARRDAQPVRGFAQDWEAARRWVCVPPNCKAPAREAVFHRWETRAEAEEYWRCALGPECPPLDPLPGR